MSAIGGKADMTLTLDSVRYCAQQTLPLDTPLGLEAYEDQCPPRER
jgi:hypothetical protein